MLEVGATATTEHGHAACSVIRILGEGSQGRVFAVSVDLSGGTQEYALKWFKTGYDTATQRDLLQALVEGGIPSNRFLWPIDLVVSDDEPGFGYLMPMRPKSFAPLSDLLNGQVDVPIAVVVTICMELAQSFLVLHSAGLCYRDINLGNIFFDPSTGAAVICDTDNVGIDGASSSEIAGSPFFSAPEILRGEALPGTATDLFSLAVLLYLLLMLEHPLEGGRSLEHEVLDQAAEFDLFASRPCFVFDPDDESNRPVPGLHDNALLFWPRFPPFVRDLFVEAFTVGLTEPGSRVAESVWRKAMGRLRDAIVPCPGCEVDAFYDEQAGTATCWRCNADIALPPTLEIDRSGAIFLTPGKVLTVHNVERTFDFTTRIAEVAVHPDNRRLIGLRNLTTTPWEAQLPSGVTSAIPPERAVALVDGMLIRFTPGHVSHVGLRHPAPHSLERISQHRDAPLDRQ